MRRLLPAGLAARFSLLLVAALLGANLIAALLMAREGTAFDRAIRLQGDAHRLHALVTALEAADPETARMLPRNSSTGFTRFSVDPAPLGPPDAARLIMHEADMAAELPGHQILIRESAAPAGADNRAPLMLVSVRLVQGPEAGHWLNALVYPLPARSAWQWKQGFFAPLLASLLGTLAVGLVFVRRMTRPLRALAEAARAAGRGNHGARVTETGAGELREAAAAFNDMQRRIAGFEAERMRMLAAVGHDLRTPITGLRLRAELLDEAEQREAMIRILDEMAVMAEGLLQAGSGGGESEPSQPVDLDRLLAQLCADSGVAYAGAGPLVMPLRPVAMRRAIRNLLDNARRYAVPARLRLRRGPTSALIRIEDDGPGIPEALLARVTEPFVRGEASRSPDTGGAGLGLSIAQDVVRTHGGTLALTNRAEGGLRVDIRLPLRETH
ncbi:ATP-binding protein [Paracoccus binzhouensis]|uniref:ATP-binding protein n=1 Tax=Paracoccus binzhouensis TaxID=2796149 RepID=UPI0018EF2449|nr:ATP-binding protein [Paracoccus binzhouensis]